MNRRTFAVAFTVFAMVFCGFAIAESDVTEAADNEITALHGFVYNIPAQQDREVIEGVKVTALVSPGLVYETTYTGKDGSFTIGYNPDVKYLSFELAEYTVKGWSSELKKYGNTGIYSIVLKDGSSVNGIHELYDDSGYTALISRTNVMVHGVVSTVVSGEQFLLQNAHVKLESVKGDVSTTTDEKGRFEFNCSTGVTYTLTVSCGGFNEHVLQHVIPSEDPISVELVQKGHDIILGLDISHTLALFGSLIVIIMVLAALILIKRPETEDGLYVVNDLSPKKPKKKRKSNGGDQ